VEVTAHKVQLIVTLFGYPKTKIIQRKQKRSPSMAAIFFQIACVSMMLPMRFLPRPVWSWNSSIEI
jgi:hypothetical protein